VNEKQQVIAVLVRLALRRQAELETAVFDVYADDLLADGVAMDDLIAVCDAIGKTPRADYASAFPAVGDLLQACRSRAYNRKQAALSESAKLLPDYRQFAPVSKERAKVWMQRIRYTSKYGGTSEDAARLFPMPDERHV
jgi:hypothetical protein